MVFGFWRHQSQGDGVVERQPAAFGATAVELRSGEFANSAFTCLAVAPPATERRAGMFVLDCTPEPPGAVTLTAFGCYAGEDADAEDAAGAIAELVGDRKRLARTRLALLEEPSIQG